MNMSRETARVKLPGFGLPLTHEGTDPCTSESLNALQRWNHVPITIRDRCMLFFINTITDKVDWTRKVFDEAIVAKWKEEALTMEWEKANIEDGDMSEEMFSYCIQELRDKASIYDEYGVVPVLDITATVVKSDSVLTDDLNSALRAAVSTLENVPDSHKDWHPGSDGKVLDLVHPSLFPLIYGRSRIVPFGEISLEDSTERICEGEPIAHIDGTPTIEVMSDLTGNTTYKAWSTNFQWLPSNISFPDGKNAKIDSYVNNLHPEEHKDLYKVLEELITRTIPLWNITTSFNDNNSSQGNRAVTYEIETDPDSGSPPPRPTQPDEDEWSERAKESADYEWREEWREENRKVIKPEPCAYNGLYVQMETSGALFNNKFAFLGGKEKKLQVIIKLANIHLTPEKPEYEGGTWHVEGQLNEHIVSSALYYYDNQNITDSRLHFRTKVDAFMLYDNLRHSDRDEAGINAIFGVYNKGEFGEDNDDNEDAVQEIGSVLTREGRVIAFPNGFQHRVGNFSLLDRSKPGHRKIVALFLVDPDIPIISTANVPPQQRDWWVRELSSPGSVLRERLPVELVDMIGDMVEDFPIGMEEAKKIREKLMEERGRLDVVVDEAYRAEKYSFCEH